MKKSPSRVAWEDPAPFSGAVPVKLLEVVNSSESWSKHLLPLKCMSRMYKKFCTQCPRSQGPSANRSEAEDTYSGTESRQREENAAFSRKNHSEPCQILAYCLTS